MSDIMQKKLLDICLIAYRKKGLQQIASASHPQIPGVRYIIAWQYAEDDPEDVPAELLTRNDIKLIPNESTGGGANREIAFNAATAPFVLLGDDDISYKREYIEGLFRNFSLHPECHFLIFKYKSDRHPREYPDHEFYMDRQPKGYYCSGQEIAFRLESVRRSSIHFNSLFGVGSEFCAGEDALFVDSMIKNGLCGMFIPEYICDHEDESTGIRKINDPDFIRAKGAVFTYMHPRTWVLRMIAHSLRHGRSIKDKVDYLTSWIGGVRDLHRLTRK